MRCVLYAACVAFRVLYRASARLIGGVFYAFPGRERRLRDAEQLREKTAWHLRRIARLTDIMIDWGI